MIRILFGMSHAERASTFGMAELSKRITRELLTLATFAQTVRALSDMHGLVRHTAVEIITDAAVDYLMIRDYEALNTDQLELLHGILGESPADDCWSIVNKEAHQQLSTVSLIDTVGNAQVVVSPTSIYWKLDGWWTGRVPIQSLGGANV